MANEIADAVIPIDADTRPFEQKMASVAAKSAATSKSVASNWNDVAKKMNSNQMVSDLEQVSAMFIQVGGSVSQVASIATSSIRPIAMLSAVLGPSAPLALGLLAIPAMGFGAVAALKGVANAGIEAEDELKALGLVTEKTASRELKEYKAATTDLSIALNEIKVAAGSAAAPALTVLANATAAGIRGAQKFYDEIYPLLKVLHDIGRGGLFVVSAGITEVGVATAQMAAENNDAADTYVPLLKRMAEASKAAAEQANEINRRIQYESEIQDIMDARLVKMIEEQEALRRKSEAERQLMQDIQEALEADRQQLALIRQKNDAILEEQDARRAASDELALLLERDRQAYLQYYRDVQQFSQETADAQKEELEERKSDAEGAAQALVSYVQTILSSLQQLAAAQVAYYQDLARANAAAAQESAREQREAFEEYAAMRERRGEALTEAQIELWHKELQARTDAASHLSGTERAAALEAWNRQQSLAEAQVIIQGAQLGVSFVQALSGLLGPAAIPVGMAAAGAFIATQLQTIGMQQPPEFPTGRVPPMPSRSPDHQLVGVRDDEIILTPRGSREFERMNRGLGAGDGGSAILADLLRQIRDQLRPARGPGLLIASARRSR